jgi:hypothetical protein
MSFFAFDKQTYGFKWEHLAWDRALQSINSNLLFGGVVTDAVELGFPAEILEGCVIILMCLHVGVVCCEQQVLAVDKDVLEDV